MGEEAKLSRAETKARTRQALIDAGADLFAAEGIDGPSLDAICEHAGYTRGAFYVHFEDRDDFLAAVMEQIGRPILDVVLGADENAGFSAMSSTFLAAFMDGSYPLGPQGGVKPHQLLDACARSERVQTMYRELIDESIRRVARAIEVDQNEGRLPESLDAGTVSELLLALVVGVQVLLELGVDIDLLGGSMQLAKLLGGR